MTKIDKYFIYFLYKKFEMPAEKIAIIAGISRQYVYRIVKEVNKLTMDNK